MQLSDEHLLQRRIEKIEQLPELLKEQSKEDYVQVQSSKAIEEAMECNGISVSVMILSSEGYER